MLSTSIPLPIAVSRVLRSANRWHRCVRCQDYVDCRQEPHCCPICEFGGPRLRGVPEAVAVAAEARGQLCMPPHCVRVC